MVSLACPLEDRIQSTKPDRWEKVTSEDTDCSFQILGAQAPSPASSPNAEITAAEGGRAPNSIWYLPLSAFIVCGHGRLRRMGAAILPLSSSHHREGPLGTQPPVLCRGED